MQGSSADIALEVSGKPAPLSPFIYVVQVLVWDEGNSRTIQANALGSGGGTFLGTALRGQTGEYIDLKSSKKKRVVLLKIFNEW